MGWAVASFIALSRAVSWDLDADWVWYENWTWYLNYAAGGAVSGAITGVVLLLYLRHATVERSDAAA
jgi:hypothetical protein